jgi:uncharacterized metal-binding protein
MANECCVPNSNLMLLACSGASNVGQLSNQAVVELTQEGFGKMFCLAGIGGQLQGFVQSAKDVLEMVVIDGCSLACAKATMEQAEIRMKNYLVLTDLGIDKNKDFNLKPEEIQRVKEAIKKIAGQAQEPDMAAGSAGSCGCSCG